MTIELVRLRTEDFMTSFERASFIDLLYFDNVVFELFDNSCFEYCFSFEALLKIFIEFFDFSCIFFIDFYDFRAEG